MIVVLNILAAILGDFQVLCKVFFTLLKIAVTDSMHLVHLRMLYQL